MTTFVEDYRPIFMVVTFGFLAGAFYLTYRPRRMAASDDEAGRGPVPRMIALNKIMLWAVTAMAVAFLFGGERITSLFVPDERMTVAADMTRTVVQIKGMT